MDSIDVIPKSSLEVTLTGMPHFHKVKGDQPKNGTGQPRYGPSCMWQPSSAMIKIQFLQVPQGDARQRQFRRPECWSPDLQVNLGR